MKVAIVFAAICVVIASAGPVNHLVRNHEAEPQIISIQNDNIGVGGYNFGYVLFLICGVNFSLWFKCCKFFGNKNSSQNLFGKVL